jgi:uncharacterized delta-60 repeat protein
MHIPRHPAALAASLLAIGAVGTGVAVAATNPGDQDPDFNGGQTRLVDFPSPVDTFDYQHDTATQVTVAPDGSVYVGGYVYTGCDCDEDEQDSPVSLGHLDAAGNPLAAFGGSGVITDGDHLLHEGPTAFGFAPNGDLLVGGSARGAPQVSSLRAADGGIEGDFTVYRYDASGTFKDQAREDFDFGDFTHSFVRGFLPLAGGGQLVMGSAGDGNYNNNHFATITLGADDAITGENVDDQTQAAALAAGHQPGGPDGSYVIAGAGQVYTPPVNDDLRISEDDSPASAWVLRRYNADGTRDAGYGGDFPVDGASYVDGIDGSLAGDGATYLAGEVSTGDSSQTQIVRFTTEGQRDEAFGTQTVRSIFGDEAGPFGGPAYKIDAIAGAPDGKLIVVANHASGFEASETVVARLNTDGTLDPTFGDGGIRTLTGASGADYMDGEDAAVQKDGKAVVAGDAGRDSGEVGFRSTRAAASLSEGEQQAYVTRLAGDPKMPGTTTTTGTTPRTTTTTTQTRTTTGTTPGATTPRPVAGQSVPAKSCASRRAFGIRLRIPKGAKPVSATVKVNGRQVKVVKGSRLRSTIDLRGLPKRTVKVSITVKLSGTRKTLKGQRTYHTCIPKQGDTIPVL